MPVKVNKAKGTVSASKYNIQKSINPIIHTQTKKDMNVNFIADVKAFQSIFIVLSFILDTKSQTI